MINRGWTNLTRRHNIIYVAKLVRIEKGVSSPCVINFIFKYIILYRSKKSASNSSVKQSAADSAQHTVESSANAAHSEPAHDARAPGAAPQHAHQPAQHAAAADLALPPEDAGPERPAQFQDSVTLHWQPDTFVV